MTKRPPAPRNVSRQARDLIYSLLEKDPAQRLGARTVTEIKNHPFFRVRFILFTIYCTISICIYVFIQGLDWEKLERKEIPAPFKPMITNDMDTSNFAEEFTLMAPIYSPAPTPAAVTPRTFKVSYYTVLNSFYALELEIVVLNQDCGFSHRFFSYCDRWKLKDNSHFLYSDKSSPILFICSTKPRDIK